MAAFSCDRFFRHFVEQPAVLRQAFLQAYEPVVRVAFWVGERYGDAAFDRFASRDEVAGLKNRIGGVCGEFSDRRALFLHEIARLRRLFVHGFHPEADAVEEQQRFALKIRKSAVQLDTALFACACLYTLKGI